MAADGGRIPNLGEVDVSFLTKEQHRCRMQFQVADVKRPLLAVSTLTKSGNSVFFEADGGRIVNRRTKRIIRFVKKGGICVLEVLLAPAKGAQPPAAGPTKVDASGEGWQQVTRRGKAPGEPATAGATRAHQPPTLAAAGRPQPAKAGGGSPGPGFARPGNRR